MRPESRREQLLTQSVGTELVIYDERTHEAHHLSQTAARVWHLADGERDLDHLTTALRESIESASDADTTTIDEAASLELVRLALSELDRAGLLARALPDLAVLGEPISRRQMLGVTAALLPVVASIVAPTPAMAATCTATLPLLPFNVISSGGPITVTISTSCAWQMTPLQNFITPSTVSGMGNGSATFNVGANSSTSARVGTISVTFPGNTGAQQVAVNQSGATASAPSAVITSPDSVTAGTLVTFSGAGSQGPITSWTWDFGDGGTGSGAVVTHTYSSALLAANSQKNFTVTLSVSGPGGDSQAIKQITVVRTY